MPAGRPILLGNRRSESTHPKEIGQYSCVLSRGAALNLLEGRKDPVGCEEHVVNEDLEVSRERVQRLASGPAGGGGGTPRWRNREGEGGRWPERSAKTHPARAAPDDKDRKSGREELAQQGTCNNCRQLVCTK